MKLLCENGGNIDRKILANTLLDDYGMFYVVMLKLRKYVRTSDIAVNVIKGAVKWNLCVDAYLPEPISPPSIALPPPRASLSSLPPITRKDFLKGLEPMNPYNNVLEAYGLPVKPIKPYLSMLYFGSNEGYRLGGGVSGLNGGTWLSFSGIRTKTLQDS